MLTKNYDGLMNTFSIPRMANSRTGIKAINTFPIKRINGTVLANNQSIFGYDPSRSYFPFISWAKNMQIGAYSYENEGVTHLAAGGSNDGPENYEDYALNAFTTNDVSISTLSVSNPMIDTENGTITTTVSQTYTALKDIDITDIYVYWTGYYDYCNAALLYRKSLENSVHCAKDSNFILTFTITKKIQTNEPVQVLANVE